MAHRRFESTVKRWLETSVRGRRPARNSGRDGHGLPARRVVEGFTTEDILYEKHRVRSGIQRITVTMPREPARAGIDPRRLLIDVKGDDNLRELE